jgi:hypothetical protein
MEVKETCCVEATKQQNRREKPLTALEKLNLNGRDGEI